MESEEHTNDTTEITTLFKLSDGGKAEWWPKNQHGYPMIFMQLGHLTLSLPGWMTWIDGEGEQYWRTFALDIIRGNAERWLREPERMGQWNIVWTAGNLTAYWDMGEHIEGGRYMSLADAMWAEMGRSIDNT